MKTIILSTALIVVAGFAGAQEAFITQVGDDNAAANIQTIRGAARGGSNTQVIQQEGFGANAVQLVRGNDNQAFTYQSNYFNAGFPDSTSLIIQTEDDDLPNSRGNFQQATGNVAVHVQNQNRGGQFEHVAQTIQAGDRNIAINWTENGGNAVSRLAPNLATPSLNSQPRVANAPTVSRSDTRIVTTPGARIAVGSSF